MKNSQVRELSEKLKDILSLEIPNRKVLDKDVARALGINDTTFATIKHRNSIPYSKVVAFCAKRRININWLLFSQAVESLRDGRQRNKLTLVS